MFVNALRFLLLRRGIAVELPTRPTIRVVSMLKSLRGVTLLITSGTLKISSMFHYRALIITETALATMALHYGTVYHAI